MPEVDTDFDVIIVGCGPTGATLANLLGLRDIKVLVLEREPQIYQLPRAVHFDDETMRVFQTVGIAQQLQEKCRVNPGMRFIGKNNDLLLDWPRPGAIGRHGWHSSYRLHQPDLEKLLRAALKNHSHCALELGKQVIDLKQHPSCVHVTYEEPATGQSKRVTAKFVVGCDGANSTVRPYIDNDMEDLGFRERWLVIDAMLKHDLPELGDYTIQYCDSAQPMTYCRNPGLRRRWEMSLPKNVTDEQAVNDERIWSLLSRWISKDNALIERKAVYTFRSALAKRWRSDRIMIAGDAAHLTPPFMGQGMCTGIRDAANLAWKLARCVEERTESDFLDSYQAERSPHAREYITTAIKLGKLMSSIDQQQSTETESNKNVNPPKMASLSVQLGQSRLSGMSATACQHSGTLFSQPRLSDGRLLDNVSGYRSLLLKRHSNADSITNTTKLLWLFGDQHPELAAALDELEVEALLLRPDRYIFATATSEEGVAALVNMKQT